MGVSQDEVNKVLQNEKADLRIVGFDEEEMRLRQRMLDRPNIPLKLPQGQYIFCDFRTLQIPGVEVLPTFLTASDLFFPSSKIYFLPFIYAINEEIASEQFMLVQCCFG